MGLYYAGIGASIVGAASSTFGILSPLQSGLFIAGGVLASALHLTIENEKKRRERDIDFWKRFDLVKEDMPPLLQEKIKRPFGYSLRYTPVIGLSSETFKTKELELAEYFDVKKVDISYNNKNIFIDVYEKELEKEYPYEVTKTKGKLELIIGKTWGEKIVTVDLTKSYPHMLVGGSTGMGKTNFLRLALANLVLEGKKNVEIEIADLKGTEFYMFKDIPMCKNFISDTEQFYSFIHNLYLEMNRRYRTFQKAGVIDITRYNRNHNMPYKLILVDEFQELEPRDFKNEIKTIKKIAAKGRSAGIHMIISTQRPSADVLEGTIKNNFLNRIAFKLPDKLNSNIILDEEGAEKLRKHGNGIYKDGMDKLEFQAMYKDEDDLVKMLEPYFEKKEEIKEINNTGISRFNPMSGTHA